MPGRAHATASSASGETLNTNTNLMMLLFVLLDGGSWSIEQKLLILSNNGGQVPKYLEGDF